MSRVNELNMNDKLWWKKYKIFFFHKNDYQVSNTYETAECKFGCKIVLNVTKDRIGCKISLLSFRQQHKACKNAADVTIAIFDLFFHWLQTISTILLSFLTIHFQNN